MLQTLKNAWRTPDLRRRMLVTLFILVLFRIGASVPVPFVDASTFTEQFGDTIFSYLNLISGGALSSATLFALGISPYITASIVIQLLAVAIPALGKKIQDGEKGKDFNEKLTRIVTVVLSLVTGYGYFSLLKGKSATNSMLTNTYWAGDTFDKVMITITVVACFCAGAALVMWLGEKINEQGIGNGISMILFAGIVASLPGIVVNLIGIIIDTGINGVAKGWAKAGYIAGGVGFLVGWIVFLLLMTVFVIWITGSERRIPVQYAKRVVGRKMYGGQSSTLPIKLNMSGVMPIIFASSIISLPATIMTLFSVESADTIRENIAIAVEKGTEKPADPTFWNHFYDFMSPNGWFYPLIFIVLIIAFSYFYITISFNPVEVANNLKKNGGIIPGIRQGRPTSDYIKRILNKVTLMGAFFLAVVAIVPIVASPLVVTPILTFLYKNTASPTDTYTAMDIARYAASQAQQIASTISFGGTSLLIVIGVVQETFRGLESQLTMRNYKGFL